MKKETQKSPLKRGFTLVELLVVIVIVAALAAVVFTFASRMKKRGEVTKSLNAMRQVSVLSGIYSVENNDNLPPMQSEKENEDGSYTTLQWNLSILSLAYSDTEAERLKDVNWWKMNKPFMLSNLMINNINTPSFKPDKCGIGMNKWLQYNLIPNGGTDWILGKGGRQSLGVPKSKVARPQRTPLYATTPDFLFDSKTFTRDDGKPLIVDGKVPMIFVDGHVELVEIKRYTNVNYDEIVSR